MKDGGNAHNPLELRALADELANAEVTLIGNQLFSELDNQHNIVQICRRLRPQLRYRWRDVATKKLRLHGSYPGISDFMLFVKKEADILNDPVYGGDVLSESASTTTTRKNIKSSSAKKSSSYSVSLFNKSCILCNDNHRLFQCKRLKAMSVLDRVKYINDKQLCHVCLSSGHIAINCTNKYICTVNNCGQRHSSLIHVNHGPNPRNDMSVSLTVGHNDCMLMPIVPVTVNGIYKTYALLDTGSSDSFCSRKLSDSLHLEGPTTTYSLSTLNTMEQVKSQLVRIKVTSQHNTTTVNMDNVRVVDSIPMQNACCDLNNILIFETYTAQEMLSSIC